MGLVMYSTKKNVSCMAHIVLPNKVSSNNANNYSSEVMLSKIINDFIYKYHCNNSELRAIIVGGSRIIDSNYDIGERNIEAVKKYLTKKRIPYTIGSVGGKFSRLLRFNTTNYELDIKTIPI